MSDPLKNIEDKQAQLDLGVMTSRIYIGALQETGSAKIAFWITVAYWTGLFEASVKNDEDEEKDADGT